MKEMKEGYFKVIIYYKGEANPTIIERGTLQDAITWLFNIDNIHHFKSCDNWQIQDNKGNILKVGGIKTETVTTITTES